MAKANTYRRVTGFIGSRKFFWVIVALFVVQAVWIALSGRYPMAFDEDFHLGIIRLYAHHINPFWSTQPPAADVFGAIARDPSYLYQYLMSFPYRLISAFTSDQTVLVLILRFINIGLFVWGLVLYRKLLLKTGASRAITHFCLALFVLIPVVPLLAAQINYDNLFVPLTALFLLMAINFVQALKPGRELDIRALAWLCVVALLGSLVKYAFLPIALVAAIYALVKSWKARPALRPRLPSRLGDWLLAALLVVSFGLFTQRYGVNLIRYHSPVVSCNDVLSVNQCSAYGPWLRDYHYAQDKPGDATTSPLVFTADWFYGMWFRTFFAVDGPATGFQTRGPLVMPAIGSIAFLSFAALAAIVAYKRLLRQYDRSALLLFLAVILVYVGVLWLDEYRSFLHTWRAVAINGRYLIPIFPLLMIWGALGVNELLRRLPKLKLSLAMLALICLLWGGGALTYVLRSNTAWYWRSQPVNDANQAVQRGLGPLTPGYHDAHAFMGHHGT